MMVERSPSEAPGRMPGYANSPPSVRLIWSVKHVLLAVSPRLAEDSNEFTPGLPEALVQQWRSTATWMAPHAKYIAIYDSPFWREGGLSGEARSAIGPQLRPPSASAQGEGLLGSLEQAIGGHRQRMVTTVSWLHCRCHRCSEPRCGGLAGLSALASHECAIVIATHYPRLSSRCPRTIRLIDDRIVFAGTSVDLSVESSGLLINLNS